MVQFDHKGEKGYGHVIESGGGGDADGHEDGDLDQSDKGSDFPRYDLAQQMLCPVQFWTFSFQIFCGRDRRQHSWPRPSSVAST
jgi:hypothetical protein